MVDGETGLLVECTAAVGEVAARGASPLPKVVVDGRTRELRPPLGPSPRKLAEALLKLLTDPGLRRTMGASARRRAVECFSLDRHVEQLEAAYRGHALDSSSR